MKLDRLRAIGKTDKVLLEWKPVQRSAKNGECATQAKEKNLDLVFITITMDKQLNKPRYFSVMKLG